MSKQYTLQNDRSLDWLLHSGGAIGLVIIVSIAYWLLAVPGHAPADSAMMLATRAAQLHAVHTDLLRLNSELAAVRARVEEGSRRIPAEPRESEFLKDMMRIAAEANFTIRDYQASQPSTHTGCPHIFIDFVGSGDYHSICRLLDELSRLPRLSTIERLDIATAADDAAYPVTIQIAVYFTGRPAGDEYHGGGNNG